MTLLREKHEDAKKTKDTQAKNETKENKEASVPVFHRGAKHHKLG